MMDENFISNEMLRSTLDKQGVQILTNAELITLYGFDPARYVLQSKHGEEGLRIVKREETNAPIIEWSYPV